MGRMLQLTLSVLLRLGATPRTPGIGIVFICLIFMDIGRYLEELDPRLGGSLKVFW